MRLFGLLLHLLCICIFFACSEPVEDTFVPKEFVVPMSYEAKGVVIKKLTVRQAELDYEAVMESREALREYFGGEWPPDDFSLEQNKKELEEHEKLFDGRLSFAFTILSSDLSRVVGCIYINPTDSAGYDAQVHSWVRTGEESIALPSLVKAWIEKEWPFNDVLYW